MTTKPNEPEALEPFRSASQCTQSELALGQLLADIELTLKHARTFITSREKMHPDGVRLYDEDIAKVTAALNAYARAPAQPVADAGGVTDADREAAAAYYEATKSHRTDDHLIKLIRQGDHAHALVHAFMLHRLQSVAAATAAKDAAIRARDDHFRDAQRLTEKLVAKDAEIAILRLDLEKSEALQDAAYKAGLGAGWNFAQDDDGAGFQRARSSTEHVAELKRIRAALSEARKAGDSLAAGDRV